MGSHRALALGLLFITAAVGFVLVQIAGAVLGLAGAADPEIFGGITLSVLIGAALAIGAGAYVWTNARLNELGLEVVGELSKVTWPTGPEIRAATMAVVIATAIAAVILGFLDFLSAKVMTEWLPSGIRWAQGLFA